MQLARAGQATHTPVYFCWTRTLAIVGKHVLQLCTPRHSYIYQARGVISSTSDSGLASTARRRPPAMDSQHDAPCTHRHARAQAAEAGGGEGHRILERRFGLKEMPSAHPPGTGSLCVGEEALPGQGRAEQGRAAQGRVQRASAAVAGQGRARQGRTGQGRAQSSSMAGQGRAEQGGQGTTSRRRPDCICSKQLQKAGIVKRALLPGIRLEALCRHSGRDICKP